MNNSFKLCNQLRLLTAIALLVTFCSTSVCYAQQQVYNKELLKLKAAARLKLSAQVDEFNNYTDRPESDGPFNKTNNKAFLLQNTPLFLASDSTINKVYNYRWWMISKHLKQYNDPYDNKQYWVVTEFFGPRPWASLSGAITCPAGQQFYDVRWLRDGKFLRSYADYFMKGSASKLNQRENGNFLTYMSRPESHHFSSWMINGVDAFLKIHPDNKWLHSELPYLEKHQQVWDSLFTVKNPAAKTAGMYKILDLYDGMEFSLSAVLGLIHSDGAYSLYTADNWRNYYLGWGTDNNAAKSEQAKEYPKAFRKGYPDFYLARPSINSYMYGNLQSLATLYAVDEAIYPQDKKAQKASMYAKKAERLQQKVLNVLWDKDEQFFNTLSAGDNEYGAHDYEAKVRESVGYTPWYFDLIPGKNYTEYGKAWEMFSSRKGFYNTSGMTTAEQQHPYYNERAYAWNGRGWPFENSVVYKGYANYLRDYKKNSTQAEKELLLDHIEKLAKLHGDKQLNIGEWYIPSDGKTFGGEQDYFHSTFPDIIIEDLLGFKASHNNSFTVAPLLPNGKWDYFYLGNIRYHNHDVDIIWKKDWDAKKSGNQSKLCVWVDGKLIASSASLNGNLLVKLPN
ncbi:MGH1-like glycoside hydrolase domain-containing protein [Mucilaginibacter conchicola]|uniref:MGH1-like glycoside hydrolase domain-containing protein n=1 Tax=Mucilaginibacter conchicola TaxID=2303333 RepID=UPI0018F70FBF|nr:hypothetical protein [Mucilaginibacter conchicola]